MLGKRLRRIGENILAAEVNVRQAANDCSAMTLLGGRGYALRLVETNYYRRELGLVAGRRLSRLVGGVRAVVASLAPAR